MYYTYLGHLGRGFSFRALDGHIYMSTVIVGEGEDVLLQHQGCVQVLLMLLGLIAVLLARGTVAMWQLWRGPVPDLMDFLRSCWITWLTSSRLVPSTLVAIPNSRFCRYCF